VAIKERPILFSPPMVRSLLRIWALIFKRLRVSQ
jgi:hypothetical protein